MLLLLVLRVKVLLYPSSSPDEATFPLCLGTRWSSVVSFGYYCSGREIPVTSSIGSCVWTIQQFWGGGEYNNPIALGGIEIEFLVTEKNNKDWLTKIWTGPNHDQNAEKIICEYVNLEPRTAEKYLVWIEKFLPFTLIYWSGIIQRMKYLPMY